MQMFRDRIVHEKDYLTELDARVGDADHGSNMVRGVNAVVSRLDENPPANVTEFCNTVGMTLVSTVGGAAGPLYGTFFMRAGTAAQGAETLTGPELRDVLAAGVQGVQSRGKAQRGDKTMFDVLSAALAAVETVKDLPIVESVQHAVDGAKAELEKSRDLIAQKGRASYFGEKSRGQVDPGSASSVMLFESLVAALTKA